MDELRYQVDLLSAMNQKLENEERMYRLLCATSTSAFLYVNLFQSGGQVCSSIQEASLSGRFKRKFRERHPETYGWQYMGRVRGKRDL